MTLTTSSRINLLLSLPVLHHIFSNKVVNCLHELARFQLKPRRRVIHVHTHPDQLVLQLARGRPSGHGPCRSVCHLQAPSRRTLLHYLRVLVHSQTSLGGAPPLRCSPPPIYSYIAGPGVALILVLRSLFYSNPGYLTINVSPPRPAGTPIEPSDSTTRGGRTSPFDSLPKCLRWRASLQGPVTKLLSNELCA